MKLLIQSDDYGITKAQAHGAIEGIKNGLIRNTGFFANMPWAEEVVEWIRPYLDQIAFGIDLNASTGPSVLGYDKVPGLCHEDGSFLTSKENRALDTEENNFDHVNYDEIYAEFDAQIQKHLALVGKLPDYIHGHAYGTATTNRAYVELAKKYDRPLSTAMMEKFFLAPDENPFSLMGWYINPPTLDNQAKSSLKNHILENGNSWLNREYHSIVCHCGYVDRELMDLSSYNIYRLNDLDALLSQEVKDWVRDNNVELITYNDLDWR